MNRSVLFSVLFVLSVAACKSGPKEPAAATAEASAPFPVVSYLKSQARHIDTSLYSITKIHKAGGIADTAYLRREDFRTAAQDFLSLPDLSAKELQAKYKETKLYDEDLKKFVLSYVPKDVNDFEQVTREDVIIEPGDAADAQVQTIYIETLNNSNDSTVQKKMTWNVGQSFQVIKLVSRKDQPEEVETTDVTWTGSR